MFGKKISENQLIRLLEKGATTNLKGFTTSSGKVEGIIRFDKDFILKLEQKEPIVVPIKIDKNVDNSGKISCPKCSQGSILKGKTAYGCSDYKKGCDFVVTFDEIKKKANGKPLTKELVFQILHQ